MTGCFLFMGIILINKIKNIIICGEWLRKIYLEFWLVCAKCSQLVLLHSSNSVEKLCGEWVLSASVCGTGSFSAHTATHSTSESAHETQSFSTELLKTKKVPTNPLHKPLCKSS